MDSVGWRLEMIPEYYRRSRNKQHGAGRCSRRMALALALSCWFVATKRLARFMRWYYAAPAWLKMARSDLPSPPRSKGGS